MYSRVKMYSCPHQHTEYPQNAHGSHGSLQQVPAEPPSRPQAQQERRRESECKSDKIEELRGVEGEGVVSLVPQGKGATIESHKGDEHGYEEFIRPYKVMEAQRVGE